METSLAEKVQVARERLRGHVRKTPLEFSPFLTGLAENGPKVYLKMESEQMTGSFKFRGALNKLNRLVRESPSVRETGAMAASSGNHGLACTVAGEKLGVTVKIFIPKTSEKKGILTAYKADFAVYGEDCVDAENKARQTAKEEGIPFISPYNDIDVAAGQGTISVEIIEDLPEVDAVFISVGGGGLIAGMAAYLKYVNSNIKIIGCQPKTSSVMYDSIKAGRIVFTESGETLSDGTSGGIEEGAVTFEFCQKYVDEWILVSEEEIADAVYFVLDKHHKIMEGAAGVAVAAYMNNLSRFRSLKNIAILICGANISTNKLADIINSHL